MRKNFHIQKYAVWCANVKISTRLRCVFFDLLFTLLVAPFLFSQILLPLHRLLHIWRFGQHNSGLFSYKAAQARQVQHVLSGCIFWGRGGVGVISSTSKLP